MRSVKGCIVCKVDVCAWHCVCVLKSIEVHVVEKRMYSDYSHSIF